MALLPQEAKRMGIRPNPTAQAPQFVINAVRGRAGKYPLPRSGFTYFHNVKPWSREREQHLKQLQEDGILKAFIAISANVVGGLGQLQGQHGTWTIIAGENEADAIERADLQGDWYLTELHRVTTKVVASPASIEVPAELEEAEVIDDDDNED